MADDILTSFIWTIKNFDMCPHLIGQRLYSPTFSIGSYGFRFYLNPRGYTDTKYILGGLERIKDSGAPEILVSWKMSLDEGKQVSEYHYRSKKIFKKCSSWGSVSFIEREKLLKTERSTLMPNNVLTIQCAVLSLSVKKSHKDDRKISDDQDAEILSGDFAEILKSSIYSDIHISIVGSRFSVHKAILQSRCPKLASHLIKIRANNYILLPGIKPSVLQKLIQYLYTGVFSVSSMDEETLLAADAYNIPELRHSMTFPYCKTITGATEVVTSLLSFQWIIEDFSKLQLGQQLVYPAFCITADQWSQVQILVTIVKSESGSTGIELKFRKLSSSKVEFIRCKITTNKQVFIHQHTVSDEYEHIFEDEEWITPFGSQVELSEILLDDSLDMFFEIAMSKKEANTTVEKVSVEAKRERPGSGVIKNLNVLQEDLRGMYEDMAHHSDSAEITLSAGAKMYRVHKIILCARSPVFAKMFSGDTTERHEGVIAIDDIKPDTVSSMLKYIYCGYIEDMDISEAIDLYAAADKYELFTLRDKCATFLKANMDARDVGNILLLADGHNDESLKRCVCDYIASNPEKVIESKDGLSVLKSKSDVYSDVLNSVLQHMVSQSSKD